jgi:uncharacterized protein involved in response to NO
MTSWASHAAIGIGNLAVAVTTPEHWIASLCSFVAGALIVSAAYGWIIERAGAEHEPY